MTTTESKSQIGFLPFMVISMAWYGYAYYVSQSLATQVFGLVFLNVFIFAIPIALSGAYSLAVNQARTVSFYRQGGWAYWIFSRRFIKAILWITWSLGATFLMLVLFVTYSKIDWLGLAALIPIYWIIQKKSRHFLASELKKGYVLTNYSLSWARWICLVIMFIFYAVLIVYFDKPSSYMTLLDTVNENQKVIVENPGSWTVRFALEISTFKNGLQSWMRQQLGQFGEIWSHLIGILVGVVIFFNATATLSSFVIHRHEYRRIFGIITDDDLPAPILKKTVVLSFAAITFFLFFVCGRSALYFEELLHLHPEWLEKIHALENRIYGAVDGDQIDNNCYSANTIKKIQDSNANFLVKLNASGLRGKLENSIDKGYEQMEKNVDGYLDWYYTLGADYVRLVDVIIGKSDMKTELEKKLNKGEVAQKLSEEIDQALAKNQFINEHKSEVKRILEKNLLTGDCSKVNILQSMSLKDMFNMPDYIIGSTNFKNRLAAGGILATGVGGAVLTKVIYKGAFKVVGKGLSKVVLNKAGSASAMAIIGGAAGSIVPVVGTGIGVLAGAGFGVLLDKGILMLEEYIDRKEFEDKIITGIRESKAELKEKIFKNQSLSSQEDAQLNFKAKQGDATAQVKLGLKYQNGDGVEKNDKVAVEWYRKSADQGNSDAQANLGVMYLLGAGIEKSIENGKFWFSKSADQGNASGQNRLGVMYVIEADPKAKEAEIKKDDKEAAFKLHEEADLLFREAVSLFRKSAGQGDSEAQLNLGVMYQRGFGIEKNNEQAVSLFRKSAEQGNSDAQLNLGAMYQNGAGVRKSDEEAVSWYRKSAEQDNRDAQVSLGVMYQKGEGVEQSDEKALFWYQKATVISSKSNVRMFDTRTYKPNFSGFKSMKEVDEYVVAESKNIEVFRREETSSVSHIWVEFSEEAYYKYNVALSTLKYNMDGDTLLFTVPKLKLSFPVATNSFTFKDKCKGKIWPFPTAKDSSCKLPGFKEPLETLTVQKTSVLQQRGEERKVTIYETAAKSLADHFNEFAKINDKEIFYKNIAVVFSDEPDQPRRVFNYNKNYCGKELCKEVLLGNGQILTVH